MANSGLARMAKRTLDRLKMDMREPVQTDIGQIFIWNRDQFENTMRQHTTEDNVKTLVNLYRTKLKTAENNAALRPHKRRLNAAKKNIVLYNIEKYDASKHEMFAVKDYSTVQSMKGRMGVAFANLTGKDSKIVTGRIDKGDDPFKASGEQIGHGEFGHAVSTTKVFAAKSVMGTKTSQRKHAQKEGFKNIERHIAKYEETLDVNITMDHSQHITARGKLKKSYTAIMSGQLAEINMQDAQQEKAALAELIASVEKEYSSIVTQEGSDSLLEAIESVAVKGNFKGKHLKHVKGVKPKLVSKSQGSGTSKQTRKQKNSIGIISGSAAPKIKQQKTKRGISSSPLRLIGLINKELPDTVRKNMQEPGLQNRTGRFAESVKLTDVIQTPKGYPSFGYTYQKNPYQVFEMGRGQAPWASPERDPRKVIDRSIREIAAQFAIGRFYTRRE